MSKTTRRPEGWVIDQRIIGTICISREGKKFTDLVGYTPCINTLTVNSDVKSKTWQPEPPAGYWSRTRGNHCEWVKIIELCWYKNSRANPFHVLEGLKEYWDDPARTNKGWEAPDGIYWICGKKAYSELPKKWKGSCTLGIIRPFFFTLPRTESKLLGAPLFEILNRQKRELKRELPMAGGNQKWKEEEWPAERIIKYYGPSTWANDGSWGYWTPIYLLNRLIRLQAVVEVVSNHTSEALELLVKQHSQMRAFVYQNRLALDYLLAEEGGVCDKYNESECCMEIDDYGETIKGLAAEIKKVAHVPVQKWNSILQASWWDQIFGQGAWWKKLVFFISCSIARIIFLPCLIPCFIRLIRSVVQGMQIA
uniref:ENR1 protein n=1 Tax=Cyanistes caeruleus TaxID=156563 RepID=A0A8C0VCN9_CYACU